MSGGGKIAELVKKLGSLSTEDFKRSITSALASKMHDLTLQGFIQQRNPYGEPWEPLKGKRDHKILDKTGRMISRIRSIGYADKAKIWCSVPYAKFHQFGTRLMSAREIFPLASDGLGQIWGPALSEVAKNKIKGLLK